MLSFKALIKKNSLLVRAAALTLAGAAAVSILSTTVFAKNTYVITDGDQVTVHTTYETDPQQILKEVGLAVEDQDIVETQPNEEEGVSEITVIRGQTVVIDYCGEKTEVISYGETVQQLFDRLGISVREESDVSADMDAQIHDDMEIAISTTVESEDTYTTAIPYQTKYQDTDLLPAGEEIVAVAGVDGKLVKTDALTCVNGKEIERIPLDQYVAEQPVDEVVLRGTGDADVEADYPIIGDGVIITADGEVLTFSHRKTFTATAYCRIEEGGEVTSTGTPTRVGAIAVDPRVIPYGTRMFIVTKDGAYIYGEATAEDCGGAIKGHRLDLFYETMAECVVFGVRDCDVYFLD